MSEGTTHLNQLRSRIERYGACMAAVKSYSGEIFFLQRSELLPLLQSAKDRRAEMQSAIRVVYVIRYIYLNIRMILEQIAFAMALAHADIKDKRIKGWHPGRVVDALRKAEPTPFYPKPTNSPIEYLRQQQFSPTYRKVSAILHTGNPLRMQSSKRVDPQDTASAVDAQKALQEAQEMTKMLGEIRNLLAEHEMPTSFSGCAPWQVRMCGRRDRVTISAQYKNLVIDCWPPVSVYDEATIDFWRDGKWP